MNWIDQLYKYCITLRKLQNLQSRVNLIDNPIERAAYLAKNYGVSWQIVAQALNEMNIGIYAWRDPEVIKALNKREEI